MRADLPLLAAYAIALSLASTACGDGASPPSPPPPPPDPIVSFTAEPPYVEPGGTSTLRPVFTAGVGRIQGPLPTPLPVVSGGTYPIGPFAQGTLFRLLVVVDGVEYSSEARVPLRYRERITSATPGDARTRHGSVTLSDGRILIVGGSSSGSVFWSTSEIHDPATGTFSQAGQLPPATGGADVGRAASPLVALPGGGALMLGGEINLSDFEAATRVERWTPAAPGGPAGAPAGAWATAGNLTCNRNRHTASLLDGGRVLVAGGIAFGGTALDRDAELFVLGAGSRQPTGGEMVTRRWGHTATTLPDGRVLLAGGVAAGTGEATATAELLDPVAETFTATGALADARAYHAAALLEDGRVLVVGGDNATAGILASAELYDPATGSWTRAAGALATARTDVVALRLGSGEVLVAGGLAEGVSATASIELFQPSTGTFRASAQPLPGARTGHRAHLLPDARVLLVGGDPGSGFPVATATVFD
jgi:hypothetical protein